MAVHKHTIAVMDSPMASIASDRVFIASQCQVPNVIGGGAGQNVATVVTFNEPLPPTYCVFVLPSQDAVAFVSAKTTFGFTVNLSPRIATNTLAVGTFDVCVLAA